MYYNHSKIKSKDGLFIYINYNIIETTKTSKIDKLKIFNSKKTIEDNNIILDSAIYRCYCIKKPEFIMNLK